jgi:hypothetical protein
MRFGCLGCLTLILLMVTLGLLTFVGINLFADPDVEAPAISRTEGQAAQQKLFELAGRRAGRSARQETVVLSEREINSFLARHLADAPSLPLEHIVTKLTAGQFQVHGKTALRNLLESAPLAAQVVPWIPRQRLEAPVWLTMKGTVAVEPVTPGSSRRVARIKPTEVAIGRQRVPTWLFSMLLGRAGPRFTEWQVPTAVESVQIEDGRLIIKTR